MYCQFLMTLRDTHTHTHTHFPPHCPAPSLPLCLLHPLIFISHTLTPSILNYTHQHTHRQMSSTLKLNGWPDGESLSFSNKDLSLLSLHPPLSLSLSLWHTHTHTQINTHIPHLPSQASMCVKHTHTHTRTPYGCIITVSEAALRNNYRGWSLLLLLLFPTNKPVHKQDGGVSGGSSHLRDDAVTQRHLPYLDLSAVTFSSWWFLRMHPCHWCSIRAQNYWD